jgi:5-methylcytosine-specific restriction endonuclease McrA
MPKKGYKQTKEHRDNKGSYAKEKNPNWKGGIKINNKREYQRLAWLKWSKKYPEKRKHYRFLSTQKRKGIIGSFTFIEWELLKKQYGYTCIMCEKSEPEIKLTRDHIIPLSKGGSNFIENIQPLCMKCNQIKYNKLDWTKPVQKRNWD